MQRAKSEELLHASHNSMPSRAIIRWCSVPRNMHSMLRNPCDHDDYIRQDNAMQPMFSMQSHAIIKASPNESKFMNVMLAAQDGILHISIVQKQEGVMQTFRLARLVIKELLICWHWNITDLFVVCMDVGGKLEGDVWCYTTPSMRKKWIAALQNYGARTAHMSKYFKGMNIFDNLHMALSEAQLSETNAARQKHSKEKDLQRPEKKDYFWLQACVFLFCSVIAEIWKSFSPL
jgi:hypothetical protein